MAQDQSIKLSPNTSIGFRTPKYHFSIQDLKDMVNLHNHNTNYSIQIFSFGESWDGTTPQVHTFPNIIILYELYPIYPRSTFEQLIKAVHNWKNHTTVIITSDSIGVLQILCDQIIQPQTKRTHPDLQARFHIEFLKSVKIGGKFNCTASSSSMSPTITVNSALTIQRCRLHQVKPQDIIAFSFANYPELIIHRVKTITNNIITTQGDAYFQPDLWEITNQNLIGKVISITPPSQ